jgi:hypothetical protein
MISFNFYNFIQLLLQFLVASYGAALLILGQRPLRWVGGQLGMSFPGQAAPLKLKWCYKEGQVATKEGKKAVKIPESRA